MCQAKKPNAHQALEEKWGWHPPNSRANRPKLPNTTQQQPTKHHKKRPYPPPPHPTPPPQPPFCDVLLVAAGLYLVTLANWLCCLVGARLARLPGLPGWLVCLVCPVSLARFAPGCFKLASHHYRQHGGARKGAGKFAPEEKGQRQHQAKGELKNRVRGCPEQRRAAR